jgi:hypothetical protein
MTRFPIEVTQPPSMSPRRRRGLLALLWLPLALAAVLGWREARTHGDDATRTIAMPTSPAIEDRYGVRLLGAYVTAAGGMIEIEYQIIDPAMAGSIYDEGVSPVLDAHGARFDTLGMAGNGHSKETLVAGRTGHVLLANSRGLLHVGDQVAIVVGELSLGGVILE